MNTDPFVLNPVLAGMRKDFVKGELSEKTVTKDPVLQFDDWLKEAFAQGNAYANAMVVSTVDSDLMPSSRVMLLRDLNFGGFTFYTNYNSRKGKQIEHNSKASLLFFWPELERQVRIQGTIKKVPESASDAYFASRPFESQVGAWTSQQSTAIKSRQELDERYAKELSKYTGHAVPRPSYWGGYVLAPVKMEFWQGRAGRLHDRLEYSLNKQNKWKTVRLMP